MRAGNEPMAGSAWYCWRASALACRAGHIGCAIAQRCAFEMRISYHGPRAHDVPYTYVRDIEQLASQSDFLVLSCPGGDATRGLCSERVLRALGPRGTLVNVARGSVVDEPALVRVLQEGALGCAALDVFASEPRVPRELLSMDRVVLLRGASGTVETREAMGQLVVDNLRAHFAGQPLLTPVLTRK